MILPQNTWELKVMHEFMRNLLNVVCLSYKAGYTVSGAEYMHAYDIMRMHAPFGTNYSYVCHTITNLSKEEWDRVFETSGGILQCPLHGIL